MTDKDIENKDTVDPMIPQESASEEFDTAGKSLSDALGISFVVLKIIMIVLVIAFLASGFETVGPEEQALVLRFGKIQKVLDSGPHWIWPYPIDEIVKVPVETKVNLAVNSFWYWENALGDAPQFRQTDPYNPLQHGYCLTRSSLEDEPVILNEAVLEEAGLESQAGQEEQVLDFEGNDYNIAHTRWQLTYQIINPEYFFRNIQIRDAKPGELYADVIKSEIQPLLTSMLESAVVTTMVHFTIDQVITIRDTISNNVKVKLQDELDKIDSGIKVVSMQITESIYPPQVKEAFEAS
ncbi:SPFH domain-containing protein, partial [Planctomycetota bacterium]